MMNRFIGLCVLVIILSSCGFSDAALKKEILGKYNYSNSETDKDLFISSQSEVTFKHNNEFDEVCVYTITTFVEEYGSLTLKYKITLNGIYKIKNANLNQNVISNSINIEQIQSEDSTADFITQTTFSYLEVHFIPALKQELEKGLTAHILELNDTKMILTDDNGKQIVFEKEMVTNQTITK